jgi:hypothetical protein
MPESTAASRKVMNEEDSPVPKIAKATKGFGLNDAGPRFLLFLKVRRRSNSPELPTKTSSGFEAGTLIVFCIVLLAIAVLVFHLFHHR